MGPGAPAGAALQELPRVASAGASPAGIDLLRDSSKLTAFSALRYNHQQSGSNSAVECDLAKVEVAGSNPVSRSSSFFFLRAGSVANAGAVAKVSERQRAGARRRNPEPSGEGSLSGAVAKLSRFAGVTPSGGEGESPQTKSRVARRRISGLKAR